MEITIKKEFNSLADEISKIISRMSEDDKKALIKSRENYLNHEKRISEKTKKALIILGYKGWYLPSLSNTITFHMDLANEIANGRESYVDKELCRVIKKEFEVLCAEIINFCPARKEVLVSAFNAHKRKE